MHPRGDPTRSFRPRDRRKTDHPKEDPLDAPQGRHSIAFDGFNLNAAVTVGADERRRICDQATTQIGHPPHLNPNELIARIAALILLGAAHSCAPNGVLAQ
jgi:hypothetical protein